MKLVNWTSYPSLGNVPAETIVGPSLTVPGQTLSLQQLLDRYVRGENVKVFTPVYLGEDSDIPSDLERLDPFERMDMAREIRTAIDGHRRRVSNPEPQPGPTPAPPGE